MTRPKLDPEVEREVEVERAEYVGDFEPDDVEVAMAEDWGFIFEVRFDRDQLKTLFPAVKDDENVIQFIREAALDAARRRRSASGTEAAS